MIEPDELKRVLEAAFPQAQLIELEDMTGTKDHYQLKIVAPDFSGKNRVQQHQMIYRALGSLMQGPVHALALETLSPEEWKPTA